MKILLSTADEILQKEAGTIYQPIPVSMLLEYRFVKSETPEIPCIILQLGSFSWLKDTHRDLRLQFKIESDDTITDFGLGAPFNFGVAKEYVQHAGFGDTEIDASSGVFVSHFLQHFQKSMGFPDSTTIEFRPDQVDTTSPDWFVIGGTFTACISQEVFHAQLSLRESEVSWAREFWNHKVGTAQLEVDAILSKAGHASKLN